MEIEKEKWGFHDDYNQYAVSSYGRVYSYYINNFLKGQMSDSGYLRVKIIPNEMTLQLAQQKIRNNEILI